ncbi:MAG: diaminopimelate epimerase, partial [Bacteroidota bacterium]|nr:diaminopimelate epimerase [Bacteroidota bacterium]
IFAKYLYEYGHTSGKIFTIETLGGIVTAEVSGEAKGKANRIKVDMGKAIINTHKLPVMCDESE